MTDEIKLIESPCIGNCCLNEEDICLGCFRSLEEITSWTIVDHSTREKYMENTRQRKALKMKL